LIILERDDRFDYFTWLATFNTELPTDLSVANKIAFEKEGNEVWTSAPSYWVKEHDCLVSNTVDKVTWKKTRENYDKTEKLTEWKVNDSVIIGTGKQVTKTEIIPSSVSNKYDIVKTLEDGSSFTVTVDKTSSYAYDKYTANSSDIDFNGYQEEYYFIDDEGDLVSRNEYNSNTLAYNEEFVITADNFSGENFMRKIATFIVCLFAVLNAAEIISVGEVSLTGGSSMYEGSSSQSGGNFNLAFVPAVKFNEKVSLLPGYYATYRGSKSVYELIGGGTLYQDMMSHNITLRLINKISPHTKFKVRAGYLLNYFRETKDEDWGEGLFDYSKLTGGIEIEKKTAFFEKFILSLDILKVTFPEYASLASEQYGKEVYPGENILDFSGIMLYARILKRLGEKSILSMNATFTMKDFPEQNIILKDASFSLDKRKDRTTYINTVFSKSLSSIFSLGISA